MVRTQTAVGSGEPLVRRKIIDEGRLRAALFFAGNLRNPEPPLGRIADSSPSGAVRPGRGAEINTIPIRKPDDGRTVLYAGSSHGNMRIFCFLFVVYAERNVAIRIVFIRLFIIFVSNLTILGVMAKIKGTIVVDKERCKGCGVCASRRARAVGGGQQQRLSRCVDGQSRFLHGLCLLCGDLSG